MTLTAGTLLTDAELLAYPYIPYPPLPRPSLLRTLGNLDAEIMKLLLAEAPHSVSCVAAPITIVAATNPDGYTLVSAFQYQQFTYKSAAEVYTPITIVPLNRQDDARARHPAAVVVNQLTFLPVDPLGRRWDGSASRAWYIGDGDEIHGRRTTAPTSPASLTATLASPDSAREYFVTALRLYVLLQHDQVPESVLLKAQDRANSERLMVLSQAHKNVIISSRYGEQPVARAAPRVVTR